MDRVLDQTVKQEQDTMRLINSDSNEEDFYERPAPSVSKSGLLEPIDDVSETSDKV
jgi:hypothetical protein